MAVNDLTGQNIQDTYQKVVQTDGTNLADGTGSALPIFFDGNNVIISGSLTAQTYVVSESILNVSSGSTVFGNSSDDTHQMTGSLNVANGITGSLLGTSTIATTATTATTATQANTVDINEDESTNAAYRLTFVDNAGTGYEQLYANDSLTYNPSLNRLGNINVGTLYAATSISTSGDITADDIFLPKLGGKIQFAGDPQTYIGTTGTPEQLEIHADKDIRLQPDEDVIIYQSSTEWARFNGDDRSLNIEGNITASGHIITSNVTASANISASGEIIGIIDGGSF